jgi:FlaA1/EpsC-like NDP-sugar epimerase
MKQSKMKRIRQVLTFISFDVIAILITYLIAILMFRVLEVPVNIDEVWYALPIIIAFKILIYSFFGMYSMLVNHIGFEDVVKISFVTIFTNVSIVVFIWLTDAHFMYKTAYFFITIAEVSLVTLPRVANRLILYFKINWDWNRALGRRTLIIGAGSAGEAVLKEIYRNKDLNNMPMGFIDDDATKIGSRLSGIKILGKLEDIENFIDQFEIEEIVIAINDFPSKKIREISQLTTNRHIRIKKMMSMSELSDQSRPKIIDVKIEDLLNREEIELEDDQIETFIKGEVVLVTGGGGSIGSELCRQIVKLEPKKVIIFDIYENNTYDIQQEILRTFKKMNKEIDLTVWIGSVYNIKRLESVFETFKPTLVFHAAAYKHVPLMEDSAVEAVRTNVIGTYNCSSLAKKYKVKKFVLVSSDKAVRSTNIMGATKRFAELIIQNQQNGQTTTKFSAVRFGNVLGSNGSVIPLFKKQIEDGGPVTVTHPEITRYFMTIPEAVGLILQCGVFAKGGEVFILDMGEPTKIVHLAEKMISLNGMKPYEDIEIEFTGLRPGEKLFEELLVDHEYGNQLKTPNEKIFIEKQRDVKKEDLDFEILCGKLENLGNEEIKDCVAKIITTYNRNGHCEEKETKS